MRRKPNIELLKRLRTRFLRMRHPEHFKMDLFVQDTECGTAMCIAGHALDLQGYRVRRTSNGIPYFIDPKGKRRVNPQVTAQRELGISPLEGTILFYDMLIKTPKQAAERINELIAEHS